MPVPGVVSREVSVQVAETAAEAGTSAAERAGARIQAAVDDHGRARVLFASAPSQLPLLEALKRVDLPWAKVEALHVDEYVGVDPHAPQSFGRWLCQQFFDEVKPGAVQLINPQAEPADEAKRYSAVLQQAPIDLACLGIGVNGHLAFNEPYQWSFEDAQWGRQVRLDRVSRQQQVDDGAFALLEQVPELALSATIPCLLSSHEIVVSANGRYKAEAVHRALHDDLTPAVPATALRCHDNVSLFLDSAAAHFQPTTQAPTSQEVS